MEIIVSGLQLKINSFRCRMQIFGVQIYFQFDIRTENITFVAKIIENESAFSFFGAGCNSLPVVKVRESCCQD